jgi:hypothetical protein
MTRLFALIVCVAGALLVGSPAGAVPAPKSEGELLNDSDVVALVRVVAVTCTSAWKDDHTGETLHGYSAELEILDVKKGKVAKGDTLRVRFEDLPTGIVGPWSVFYYPGEEVWTHLQRDDGGAAYATTWWNARGRALRPPDTTDLPTRVGETARAR